MTKEQYEKLSAPYRNHKFGVRAIQFADTVLTLLIFAAYPLLLCYVFWQGDWKKGMQCMVIPAVSFCAVSLFRKKYSAKRPYEVLEIQPLLSKDTVGKSFPSRHVFSIFMIGMTFLYISKPLGLLIGILGLLMAYVRVVGGVHFPKDVLAGAGIGIICGMLYFLF